jgi:NAD(P)-dependent dehydrogenase (short-subunit alcohol dehydrogenase family)
MRHSTVAGGNAGAVFWRTSSGHHLGALTAEQDAALATTPADELLSLPMLQPSQVTDSLHACQLAKRGNSLRVMAEAVRWRKRGARVNTISPGIIITPLARDDLTGPRGEGYRRMLELSPARRAGTPDEVGTIGALLMGPTKRSSPEAMSSLISKSSHAPAAERPDPPSASAVAWPIADDTRLCLSPHGARTSPDRAAFGPRSRLPGRRD